MLGPDLQIRWEGEGNVVDLDDILASPLFLDSPPDWASQEVEKCGPVDLPRMFQQSEV